MKNFNFLTALLFINYTTFSNVLLGQKVIFNAETLAIDKSQAKFKKDAINKIEVTEYDVTKEILEFEVTFSDIRNEEGIRKFASITIASTRAAPTYFFSFIVEDKDYTNIKITRKDSSGNVVETRTYTFRNYGGVRFDVSSGFFATDLRDKTYQLKYISDSTREIIKEKNGNFRGGIGLLAHLHSRTKYPVNFGASLGFELDGDAKLSYLGGGSILFGYDKKFVFSVGMAASKVDVLSKLYIEGEDVSSQITIVPTAKIWKLGCFVSTSYNF